MRCLVCPTTLKPEELRLQLTQVVIHRQSLQCRVGEHIKLDHRHRSQAAVLQAAQVVQVLRLPLRLYLRAAQKAGLDVQSLKLQIMMLASLKP